MPIIAANPWAVLVSCTDEAPLASHIPVILDREGEPGATLLGHLARANPHSRLLSRRGRFSKPKLSTIGPGANVINFYSPDSQLMKSRLTRRVDRSRADDHENR